MIVAEIIVTQDHFARDSIIHCAAFEDLETARAEYERIAQFFIDKADKKNDLPKTLTIKGVNEVTLPFDSIASVALRDYVKENAARVGMRDAFPNIFKA